MEWINIIVSGVCAILGALGGSVGTGIIFYRQTKRTKTAEAEQAEQHTAHEYVKEWRELYEKKEAKVNELDVKIDELRSDMREKEQELRDKEKHINQLSLQVERLQWAKCTVNGCTKRQPPHYYDESGNEVVRNCEHCDK